MSYFRNFVIGGAIYKRLVDPSRVEKDEAGEQMEYGRLSFARDIQHALTHAVPSCGEVRGHPMPLAEDGECVMHLSRTTRKDGTVMYRAQFWHKTEKEALTR